MKIVKVVNDSIAKLSIGVIYNSYEYVYKIPKLQEEWINVLKIFLPRGKTVLKSVHSFGFQHRVACGEKNNFWKNTFLAL